MNKEKIRSDLQTFADDEASVVFDSDGTVMFTRGGKDLMFKVVTDFKSGHDFIEFEDKRMPYRKFLAQEVAHLDIFAKKIIDKSILIDSFVNGPGVLKTINHQFEGPCLSLLGRECSEFLKFGSKLTFITADAGHGKTALLRQYQYYQAQKYLSNTDHFLFWHIDLQGRDLVRLPEAIMYEVANLRLQGIYYPSIITLIRNKFLVLGIDGFDELAAEIGGVNAIGALSSLVSEMEGEGTLVAASRRTFFDTQDYLKRTKFLKGNVANECEFNELVIKNWTSDEDIAYIRFHLQEPQKVYKSILTELNSDESHPILTRPFLLTKVIHGIKEANCEPSEFFGHIEDDKEGVKSVVEAFTLREVDKWKERDAKTGKPYLSFDQHIELLAVISKEMWENKRESISVEEIQFITTILLEEWTIDKELYAQIVRMVESHAFMIPVMDAKSNLRKFDHEEFKNYFLARNLSRMIDNSLKDGTSSALKKFLYIDQLPDSVAKFCFDYIDSLPEKVQRIVNLFTQIINDEWKPTYLQPNIGTLIPYLLDSQDLQERVKLHLAVSYSSIIFENKGLKNVEFKGATFINISIRDTVLENVTFANCVFNEIKINTDSKNHFKKVTFDNCQINSITIFKGDEIMESAYSPSRITQLLQGRNIEIVDSSRKFQLPLEPIEDSDFKKLVYRFLLRFNRTVYQFERNIITEKQFGLQSEVVLHEVIPLLERHGVIEVKETKQSKQMNSKAWITSMELEDILKADDPSDNSSLGMFWKAVNSYIPA